MIHFAAPADCIWGIQDYLGSEGGRGLAGRVQAVAYEDLFRAKKAPAGTWVFAALDRLTPAGAEILALIWETLARAGFRLLNHPQLALRRYGLLRELHCAGINRFQAVRASEYAGGLRFPVFLRQEDQHSGNLSGLLHSERQVREALLWTRLHGLHARDLLIVEFCDISDGGGLFRKYSSFVVGGRVMARHCQTSRNWVVRAHSRLLEEQHAVTEHAYVTSNPHAEWLAPIFQLARIDYGRIDYSLSGDAPQIWEINTNPTIGRGRKKGPRNAVQESYHELLRPAMEVFHRRFRKAFEAIDEGREGGRVELTVPPRLLRQWEREEAKRRREARVAGLLRAMFQSRLGEALRPLVERPVRKAISLLAS